jgi:hypothetical protein
MMASQSAAPPPAPGNGAFSEDFNADPSIQKKGRRMTSNPSTHCLAQCTFLSSQLMKYLAIPALFFSDMNW